jgi:hypothetical protein
VTYAAHLAEELWAGESFPVWVARITGTPLPVDVFLTLNAIGMTLVVVAAVLGAVSRRLAILAVTLAGIVTLNAAAHTIATIWLGVYSPGLVTGLLLWAPLGILSLVRSRRQFAPRAWAMALVWSVVVHGVVSLLAFTSRA